MTAFLADKDASDPTCGCVRFVGGRTGAECESLCHSGRATFLNREQHISRVRPIGFLSLWVVLTTVSSDVAFTTRILAT